MFSSLIHIHARFLMGGLLVISLAGCGIFGIGSWPQPEGDPSVETTEPKPAPASDEECDGIDNDVDGAVDEGCECADAPPRDCLRVSEQGCEAGLQYCEAGYWGACENTSYLADATSVGLSFEEVSPQPWLFSGDDLLKVVVRVELPCDGLAVPYVALTLEVDTPSMSVHYKLLDDGAQGDLEAGDGLYSFEIESPFGPGVLPQPVSLMGSVVVDGETYTVSLALDSEGN